MSDESGTARAAVCHGPGRFWCCFTSPQIQVQEAAVSWKNKRVYAVLQRGGGLRKPGTREGVRKPGTPACLETPSYKHGICTWVCQHTSSSPTAVMQARYLQMRGAAPPRTPYKLFSKTRHANTVFGNPSRPTCWTSKNFLESFRAHLRDLKHLLKRGGGGANPPPPTPRLSILSAKPVPCLSEYKLISKTRDASAVFAGRGGGSACAPHKPSYNT